MNKLLQLINLCKASDPFPPSNTGGRGISTEHFKVSGYSKHPINKNGIGVP